jgi:hypothetical protein
VRGLDDHHLLETPDPELLRKVTGLELEPSGHALLDQVGVRSTQRLALGDVGGGIAVLTWPGELQPQAKYLYSGERAKCLLLAAVEDQWEIDARPQLAFWLSKPAERVYLNPTVTAEEYVARWSGQDRDRIGQYEASTLLTELWPWLLKRGFASSEDESMLAPYLGKLRARRRPAHLRPGLRLLRRWTRDDVATLGTRDALAGQIRESVNRLLDAVDDPPLGSTTPLL